MVQTPPAGILSNEVKKRCFFVCFFLKCLCFITPARASLSFASLPLGKAVSVDLMKDNSLLRQSVYARHFSAGPVSKTGAVVDHVTM